MESSGHRLVGDSLQPFGPGDLVLLGPNLPHVWINPAPCRRAQAVVLQFLPGFAGEDWLRLEEMRPVRALLEAAAGGLVFRAATRDAVAPLLRRLLSAQGPVRLAVFLEVLALLSADPGLPVLRGTPGQVPAGALSPADSVRIGKVLQHLAGNFREPVRQMELARLAGLSPAAFSRFFLRATGKGFKQLLLEMRLNEACALLAGSAETVVGICFRSGFENLSNFNRQFRARHGVTPSRWRQDARSQSLQPRR